VARALRRVLVVVAVAAVASSVSYATDAPRSRRETGQSPPNGTQVGAPDANGVVHITVPVDLTLVGKSTLTDADRARIRGREYEMNNAIGGLENFSNYKYKACDGNSLTFDVKVKLTALPDSDGPEAVPGEGHHFIQMVDDPEQYTFTNIYDPDKMAANGGQGDSTIDSTKPYDGWTDGTWEWNVGYWGWVHEVGHLLGLGDDYVFKGTDENGDPIPVPLIRDGSNRQGTLMDTAPLRWGVRVHLGYDQELIDRVGKLLDKAGKLPSCWQGTIESDSHRTYVYSDGGGAQCDDHWHGEIAFVAKAGGTVTGKGKLTLTSGPTCSGQIDPAYIVPTREIDFSVSGNKQKAGFILVLGELAFRPPVPAASWAGITTLVSTGLTASGPPLTIPNTGPCTAGGTVATSYTINSDTFTASNVFALKCKGN